jgi:hypothetical protein
MFPYIAVYDKDLLILDTYERRSVFNPKHILSVDVDPNNRTVLVLKFKEPENDTEELCYNVGEENAIKFEEFIKSKIEESSIK